MLVAVWVAFVVRGAYYCAAQPLWEGVDEWAHFAYVQALAETGVIPQRMDRVGPVVERSLELVPLAPAAAQFVPGTTTHAEYRKLPEAVRREREALVSQLRATQQLPVGADGPRQYEAQQPPLYYVLFVLPYRATAGMPLVTQVLLLRLLNVLIASVVVYLAWLAARMLLPGLLVPVMVASLPGLMINVCRVGNESLAIVLCSAVLVLLIRLERGPARLGLWAVLGVVMGAALLTKAYALAFLLVVCWVGRKNWKGAGLALGLVAAIAGWWYWQCWLTTGTLSGEQLDVAASQGRGLWGKLQAVGQVRWMAVLDSAAFTHIWVGGWSFITARSWMYRVFECIGVVALVGVLWRARAAWVVVMLFYGAMGAALAYHALVVYLVRGVSTALGWYLYAAVVAEALLVAQGWAALFGVRTVAGICVLLCAFDVFTSQALLVPMAGVMRGCYFVATLVLVGVAMRSAHDHSRG